MRATVARTKKIIEDICLVFTIILAIPLFMLAFIIMLISSLFAPE